MRSRTAESLQKISGKSEDMSEEQARDSTEQAHRQPPQARTGELMTSIALSNR